MEQIINKLLGGYQQIVVESENIKDVIDVLYTHNIEAKHVLSCGWKDAQNQYFVGFNATKKTMEKIMSDLNVTVVEGNMDIPQDISGKFYMTKK